MSDPRTIATTTDRSTFEPASPVGRFLESHGWLLAVGLCLATLLWMASVHIDAVAQMVTAGGIVILLVALRKLNVKGMPRMIFLFLAAFLSIRYFIWRSVNTIETENALSFSFAMLLYFAEAYGIIVYLLGVFVNINPLRRQPAKLPKDPAEWPSVDVFVPTYNEPEEIIETTLIASLQIDYPEDKIRVHLLDDGGTDQKCNDKDPDKAAEARARRVHLQGLCRKLGVDYRTRARNEHAKAGNLNEAFHETSGDLILILDTDHVPASDIMKQTAGWFVRDPKMFLVQTPHFFINSDPIEKNLDTFHQMPSENEMFYSVIQQGLDFWNSAFFCGSAAVLRRKCLAEVGGIAGETITEDAETALSLHARGYKSAYIRRPLIAGLAPETMGGFTIQRIRWAQGMAQIFLLKNPLFIPGLKLWQRFCYFNSCFFWFFGYARLVFVIAPLLFLIFGMQIYRANLPEFIAFAVPHVIAALLVSDFLYGKVRWLLVSELYELVQCVYTLPALIKVFLKPRAPAFNVTPKGETLDREFSSPLGRPFYLLTALTLIGMGFGVWRYFNFPEQQHVVWITMGWAAFNLMLLLATIGVLFERQQRRAFPRMPANWDGELKLASGEVVPVRIADIAVGGAGLTMDGSPDLSPASGEKVSLTIFGGPEKHQGQAFHSRTRLVVRRGGEPAIVGLEFQHQSQEETAAKIAFVYGDSERWVKFQEDRAREVGMGTGIVFLAWTGGKRAVQHLWFQLAAWGRGFAKGARSVGRFVWGPPIPKAAAKPQPATEPAEAVAVSAEKVDEPAAESAGSTTPVFAFERPPQTVDSGVRGRPLFSLSD